MLILGLITPRNVQALRVKPMLVGEQYARPHRNAQRCPYRVPDWGMGPGAISLCPRYYLSPKRAILLVPELSQSGNILDEAGPRSRGAMADPK